MIDIYDEAEFHHQLETAGDKLIVLEVESESVCQGGPEDEPEFLWKVDKEASMAPCRGIKHSLQRIARECPDVKFLSMQVGLGADATLPTTLWPVACSALRWQLS